jgi:hypothetical protein
MVTNREKLIRAKEWIQIFHSNESGKPNLDQLENALKSDKEGRYGFCQICGRTIGYSEISALPQLTVCMSCGIRTSNYFWTSSENDINTYCVQKSNKHCFSL